ncbi:MAG: endolytic transglycosylase MltG, partial [Actinomycetota bacterium]|nr:endolytic transglycosylase MltG [Actinomycetota bacterium]
GHRMSDPGPRRPSRATFLVRRAIALVAIVGSVALAGWATAAAVRSVGEEETAAPTTTAAAVRPRPPKPLRIIFPEGFTRRQMADRIAAVNEIAREKRNVRPRLSPREYLRLTARHPLPGRFAGDGRRRSLEGFLFPATYEFLARTTTKQLVTRQLEAFQRNWDRVDLRYARSKNLTPYDVLIIASMVEKETAAAAERPLVAAVIYNRLRIDMPLYIDATIRYGLNVPPTESLRQSHLRHPTPYNTRVHQGLPPTPIANPGLASIRAAARPAKVDYLYFVRKPDKVHHFFTASEREFLRYLAEHGYGG